MAYFSAPTLGASGLNKEFDPQFLSSVQGQTIQFAYQDGRNVDVDSLTIKKRQGIVSWFSGIQGIPQLSQDFVDATNKRWIVIVTTQKIYTFDEVSLTLTDRTPAGYSGTLTSPPRGETFQFKHFLVNGIGFWYWDGIAATYQTMPAGSPTTALDLFGFGNHLILLNVTSSGGVVDPYKVAWSDFLNGLSFTTGDALSADIPDGSDFIVGGATFGRVAVLAKTDSLYSITPIQAPFFYQFDPRVTGQGAVATATIVRIPGIGISFLGRDDWYLYDLVTVLPVGGLQGESVRKDIFANMNAQVVSAAFTVRDMRNQRLLLFVPSSAWTTSAPTYNVYAYNWRYRTLSRYDFSAIPGQISGGGDHIYNVGRLWSQSTYAFSASPYRFNDLAAQPAPTLVLGGATSGKIYRLPAVPQYTDDGYAYQSWAATGLTDFGQPWPIRKTVNRIHILFVPQAAGAINLFLLASEDGGNQTQIGPVPENQFVPMSVGAWFGVTGTHFGFRIDDQGGTNYWEAKSASLEVVIGGER